MNIMPRLKCLVLGHHYYVVQEFSEHTRKIACERCKKVWGMNDRERAILQWDSDFDDLYYNVFKYPNVKPWR